jgi:hypothetical protein
MGDILGAMPSLAARRRDPGLAALFSAVLPGSGLLYADETPAFVIVLSVEIALFALGWWFPLVVLHAVQIAVSAGTAWTATERARDVFSARRDPSVTDVGEAQPES